MTRVYSNPDPSIAHLVRNAIDEIGVPAVVRGDGSVTLTEVPGTAAWAEVWVPDESVAAVAPIVAEVTAEPTVAPETWTCPTCDEVVDGSFAVCWACGSYAPEA